jgi:hypothetical protein
VHPLIGFARVQSGDIEFSALLARLLATCS